MIPVKKLLCLLMLIFLLPLTALAEFPVQQVTIVNTYPLQLNTSIGQHITDAAYIELLVGMLTSPTETCDSLNSLAGLDQYKVYCLLDEQKYAIYQVFHDDLYNQAWLLTPAGETFSIGCELPLLLRNTLRTSPGFTIPEEHRSLLAEHGWTIAFRQTCMFETLPAELTAFRTDPTALHFTWADLFLQDAGYDITPYLGKTVLPYMYYLVEPVNRVKWVPSDVEIIEEFGHGGVLYSMKAVVLECEGEIIGAYLLALSLDGSNLMSLAGNTAIDLLGEDGIRAYLLAHSEPDADLAALTPEEVIQLYSETHDLRLETINGVLLDLGTAFEGGLYRRFNYDPETIHPDPAVTVRALDFDNMYEVRTEDGEIWFPQLEWESDQTGWKIVHYYNSGF